MLNITRYHQQYADLPFAFWALKRLDHDMRNDPKRASYGKFHGTPAAIVLKLWELDRWTTVTFSHRMRQEPEPSDCR